MTARPRYILWGSSGHAKVLADVIRLSGGEIVALFDNDAQAVSSLPGVPLYHGKVGFAAWRNSLNGGGAFHAALAIGGRLGEGRKDIAAFLGQHGIEEFPNLIHPSAAVSATARIGKGCQVLARAVVAADASLGNYSIVNNAASVDHECRLGEGVHVAPGATLCGLVQVDDFAMIGAGAVVLPRLRIGKRAMVGAGAVVTRDVPDGVTVIGNPARAIAEKTFRRKAASLV